jgi:hypothetical protein
MDELEESAAAYDGLPISSGGAQGLGRISARDALNAWLRFLDMRTEAAPARCWFDFPMTPGLTVDPKVVRLIAREFSGSRSRHPVPRDRADDALSLFESLEPLPTNQWGMAPVWLCFAAGFRIRSPRGQELWARARPGPLQPFRDSGWREAGSIIDPADVAREARVGAEPEHPAGIGCRTG